MKKSLFNALIILTMSVAVLFSFVACDGNPISSNSFSNSENNGAFSIGGKNYQTLQAAVDSLIDKGASKIGADYTIKLLRDVSDEGAEIKGISVEFKIDFSGYTYTLTGNKGITIASDVEGVEIANGSIQVDENTTVGTVIVSSAKLKIDGATIDVSNSAAGAIEVSGTATVELSGSAVVKTGNDKNVIKASGTASVRITSEDVEVSGGFVFDGSSKLDAEVGNIEITSISVEEGNEDALKINSSVSLTVPDTDVQQTVMGNLDKQADNSITEDDIGVGDDDVIITVTKLAGELVNVEAIKNIISAFRDFEFNLEDIDSVEYSVTAPNSLEAQTFEAYGEEIKIPAISDIHDVSTSVDLSEFKCSFEVDEKEVVFEWLNDRSNPEAPGERCARYSVNGGEEVEVHPYSDNTSDEYELYYNCFRAIEYFSEFEYTSIEYSVKNDDYALSVKATGSLVGDNKADTAESLFLDSLDAECVSNGYTVTLSAKDIDASLLMSNKYTYYENSSHSISHSVFDVEAGSVSLKIEKGDAVLSLSVDGEFNLDQSSEETGTRNEYGYFDYDRSGTSVCLGSVNVGLSLKDKARSASLKMKVTMDKTFTFGDKPESYNGDLRQFLKKNYGVTLSDISFIVNKKTYEVDTYLTMLGALINLL